MTNEFLKPLGLGLFRSDITCIWMNGRCVWGPTSPKADIEGIRSRNPILIASWVYVGFTGVHYLIWSPPIQIRKEGREGLSTHFREKQPQVLDFRYATLLCQTIKSRKVGQPQSATCSQIWNSDNQDFKIHPHSKWMVFPWYVMLTLW